MIYRVIAIAMLAILHAVQVVWPIMLSCSMGCLSTLCTAVSAIKILLYQSDRQLFFGL